MIRILFVLLLVSLPLSSMGCGCPKKENHEAKEEEHHEEEVHLKAESQKMIGLELVTIKKTLLVSLIHL